MPINRQLQLSGKKGREKKIKKSKRIYRTSQKIRIINVFLESLLSESFPELGITVHLTSLGCPPILLISGPAVGAAQILICSTPVCSCLQCPQLSELVRFPLWALSMAFYIFHRHRVCLVDCVDLICSLYSWFLSTVPLGFNCGLISTSTCVSSTGV